MKTEKKKKVKRKHTLNRLKVFSIFFMFICFVSLFAFVLKNMDSFSYTVDFLKVGDLVSKDLTIERNIRFVDTEATAEERKKAAANTPRVFCRDDSKTISGISLLAYDERHTTGVDKKDFELLRTVLNGIYQVGFYDYDELSSDSVAQIEFDGKLYNKDRVLNDANLDEFLFSNYNIVSDDSFVIRNIRKYLDANMIVDIARTAARQKEAVDSVDEVVIDLQKGSTMLLKDEIITNTKLDRLKKIRRYENVYDTIRLAISICFSFLCFYVVFYFLRKNFALNAIRGEQFFYIACISEIIFFFLTFLLYLFIYSFNLTLYDARAFICMPSMFIAGLTGNKRNGYFLAGLNLILISMLPYISIPVLLKEIVITIIAVNIFDSNATGIKNAGRWLSFVLSVLAVVFLINVIFYPVNSMMISDTVFQGIAAGISYIICIAFMSVLESVLNLPTLNKLRSLDTNLNVLLEKFKAACPGSYEHSLAVANIAEAAATAINADSMLVKVAARYHDVGKMEHPEYFTENQKGSNKHNFINSKLSAAIIKSHVTLGVKKLRESELGIPEEVIQIISEHHGNDLISYFYFAAQKEFEKNEVDVEDFKYDSNLPVSKESSILMLSDISEAAVRSLENSLNENELAEFIHKLFTAKIERKQLEDSALTFGEMDVIEKTIFEYIKGIEHKRISYQTPN